jgi:small subunit ribosomal protein S6
MLFYKQIPSAIAKIARRPKGGSKMRKYEIMYILRADLDEAGRAAAMEKLAELLKKNGASIDKVDESMGLRDLAYPIDYEVKGYYVVLKVSAEQAALYEFNRKVRHDANVLRFLIVADQE